MRNNVRRGFTLIELMVTISIIAILMTVVFKIAGLGKDASAKNITINRLQRLENALSGFYAAYGCYPPVPLQGVSRDIFIYCDDYGVQDTSRKNNGSLGSNSDHNRMWKQVKAALMAQPVACIYPYPESMNDYILQVSEMQKQFHSEGVSGFEDDKFAQGFENASGANVGGIFGATINQQGSAFDGKARRLSPYWNDCQLFRYGLLSFLLPRYLFMMSGAPEFYRSSASGNIQTAYYEQWGGFNQLPCRVSDGTRYSGWTEIRNKMYSSSGNETSGNREDKAEISSLPSQAVCRRWMPNLEGIVRGGKTFYGINTVDVYGEGDALRAENPNIPLYNSNGINYVLGEMTVLDGWDNPIYYYSEAPYQSYRLWSGGANGKSFPPWIPLDTLSSADRKTASEWMADDVMMLSH